MQINDKLNLAYALENAQGQSVWTHSTPIAREVFEANFLLLGKTFAALHSEGLDVLAGPRVAALMLHQMGVSLAQELLPSSAGREQREHVTSLAAPLLAEIRRRTSVVAATAKGYETYLLDDAINAKLIDEEDMAEVMGGLCFFTVGYHMYPRRLRQQRLVSASQLWGSQITSLTLTEYIASLPTLTLPEISQVSPPTVATSSLPL